MNKGFVEKILSESSLEVIPINQNSKSKIVIFADILFIKDIEEALNQSNKDNDGPVVIFYDDNFELVNEPGLGW